MFVECGKNTKAFKENVKLQIDEEDYEKHFKEKSIYLNGNGYALSNNIGIHRIIMDITDSKLQIDHINHDKLDNRKENLRVVTHQQNSYNKTVYKNNESGYTGVHLYKPTGKYMAYIKANNKRKHLGYYKTIEEAYTAYVRASKALHGEYAPNRIKDIELPLEEPQPKVYKSPVWSRENYKKYRSEKLKKQTLRNIKKTGKIPKPSTIENNNITNEEINEMIAIFEKH